MTTPPHRSHSRPTAFLHPDAEQLRAFWRALVTPGDVREVRIPGSRRGGPRRFYGPVSGYFDNVEDFVRELSTITGNDAEAVYMTLNPVNPALKARASNRLKSPAKETTSDVDVLCRHTLLIDIDPNRPAGISATDAEQAAALAVRDAVKDYLTDLGWPEPVAITASGNGGGLLYRIALPNDPDATRLIEGVLKGLAATFNTNAVTIDTSTANAARITKVVGSIAAKGDNLPEQPWRLATGTFAVETQAVSRDLLEAVAEPPPDQPPGAPRTHPSATTARFDIREILRSNGIEWREKSRSYGTVLQLDRCLTSTDHTDGACIIEFDSGALDYRCLHDRCADKRWNPHAREALGLAQVQSGNGSQVRTFTGQPDELEHVPWELPIPLSEVVRPPFPTEMFPGWLQDYVDALAVATQTPPDLAGMLVLAVLGATGAKRVEVLARLGWREPVNLYTVVALPPGNRKSQVFSDVMAPLEGFEREETQRLKPQVAEAQNQRKVLEESVHIANRSAAKASGAERVKALADADHLARELAGLDVPVSPRLIADDVSPEKVGGLLAEQGGRLAVLSAEGGVFELIAGRYSANGAPNLDVFLKGHAGDNLRVDRVGRTSEYVPTPALTLGLAVQPEVVRGLATKPGFRGRGLLARILYAMPESRVGRRLTNAPPVPEVVRSEYHRRIRALLRLSPGTDADGNPMPHVLTLNDAADQVFRQFEDQLEPQLSEFGELGGVADWGSKLAGAVLRIAGLLHLAEHADTICPWERPIGAATMHAAVWIGHYLTTHARIAFAEMGADPVVADAQHLLGWIRDRDVTSVTKRDLYQGTKGRFPRALQLEAPLQVLVEHDYLRKRPHEERSGPGRPASPIYDVNPLWLSHNPHNPHNAHATAHSEDSENIEKERDRLHLVAGSASPNVGTSESPPDNGPWDDGEERVEWSA